MGLKNKVRPLLALKKISRAKPAHIKRPVLKAPYGHHLGRAFQKERTQLGAQAGLRRKFGTHFKSELPIWDDGDSAHGEKSDVVRALNCDIKRI